MRKFLISTIILSLTVFCFSYTFAASNLATDTKDTTDKVGNAISNTANGAKNAVMNTGNAIANGANDAKNAVSNTSRDIMNGTENVINDVADGIEGATDYTAERTATNGNLLGMNSTSWTWLILGVVAAAIIFLVWRYGKQYEHTSHHDE